MLEGKAKLIFLGVSWLVLLGLTIFGGVALGPDDPVVVGGILGLLSPVILIIVKGRL